MKRLQRDRESSSKSSTSEVHSPETNTIPPRMYWNYLHVHQFPTRKVPARKRGSRTAHPTNPLTANLNLSRPRALVPLGRHNHVVPAAQVEVALLLPLVEMLARVDGAADTLDPADRPVLVKGRSALDGRLVDALGLVDVIGAAIVLDGAELLRSRRGIVRAVRLDDVVLDQRVLGPAVQGEVCAAMLVSNSNSSLLVEKGKGTYSCSHCSCSRFRCTKPCAGDPGSSPCRRPSC